MPRKSIGWLMGQHTQRLILPRDTMPINYSVTQLLLIDECDIIKDAPGINFFGPLFFSFSFFFFFKRLVEKCGQKITVEMQFLFGP